MRMLSPTKDNFSGQSSPAQIEPLEQRSMLSLTVTSILADNRGEVTLTLNGAAKAATVNRASVQMYLAGKDGLFSTSDDIKVSAPVGYYPSAKRIVIRANIPANTPYRVKLVATRMLDTHGRRLDGDFHGTFPSGNGKVGGNTEFLVTPDTSDAPYVRMSTSEGIVNLQLFRTLKPISVQNFLSYADAGGYDSIFFTRSLPQFVVQAGAVGISSDDSLVMQPSGDPIVNEFSDNTILTNARGTLAFAKQPSNPDSATNEFFFNLSDNGGTDPYGLDFQNGGFTVFATVADSPSLKVMDKIGDVPTVALYNPLTGSGLFPVPDSISVTDVPVTNTAHLSGEIETVENPPAPYPARQQFVVTDGVDPAADFVTIRRTAVLMNVAPVR